MNDIITQLHALRRSIAVQAYQDDGIGPPANGWWSLWQARRGLMGAIDDLDRLAEMCGHAGRLQASTPPGGGNCTGAKSSER